MWRVIFGKMSITNEQIEQWLDAKGIQDPGMREMMRVGLYKLRDEDRLHLESIGFTARATVNKFDHERGPDPVLVEQVVVEEENGEIMATRKNGADLEGI